MNQHSYKDSSIPQLDGQMWSQDLLPRLTIPPATSLLPPTPNFHLTGSSSMCEALGMSFLGEMAWEGSSALYFAQVMPELQGGQGSSAPFYDGPDPLRFPTPLQTPSQPDPISLPYAQLSQEEIDWNLFLNDPDVFPALQPGEGYAVAPPFPGDDFFEDLLQRALAREATTVTCTENNQSITAVRSVQQRGRVSSQRPNHAQRSASNRVLRERTYVCEVAGCDAARRTNVDMERHCLSHYLQCFVCPGCKRSFKRACFLKRHLQTPEAGESVDGKPSCISAAGPESEWGETMSKFMRIMLVQFAKENPELGVVALEAAASKNGRLTARRAWRFKGLGPMSKLQPQVRKSQRRSSRRSIA